MVCVEKATLTGNWRDRRTVRDDKRNTGGRSLNRKRSRVRPAKFGGEYHLHKEMQVKSL